MRTHRRLKRALLFTLKFSSRPGFLFDLAGLLAYRRWEDHEGCRKIRALQAEWIETASFFARVRITWEIVGVGSGINALVNWIVWAWREANSYVRNKLLGWDDP